MNDREDCDIKLLFHSQPKSAGQVHSFYIVSESSALDLLLLQLKV